MLVELVITTCRRLDYFVQTMDSLYNNLLDLRMLNRISVFDDNSSADDFAEMQWLYPGVEYHRTDRPGLARSLYLVQRHVRSEFLVYWQDDFLLAEKKSFIPRCIEIIHRHKQVGSVLLTQNLGDRRTDEFGEYTLKQYHSSIGSSLDDKVGFDRKLGQPKWPGYSHNPGVHQMCVLDKVGYHREVPNFEWDYAQRYYWAEYRVAHLADRHVQHIGKNSAFRLNGTPR